MTLNKVIAEALYIVICDWNAVKVQGCWQLTVKWRLKQRHDYFVGVGRSFAILLLNFSPSRLQYRLRMKLYQWCRRTYEGKGSKLYRSRQCSGCCRQAAENRFRTAHCELHSQESTIIKIKANSDWFILSQYWLWWVMTLITPPDVSREGLECYQWTFFCYQYTALSSRALDGYQCRGSIVSNSTIGIEISTIPSLIFRGGQKVRNLASFSTSLKFEKPAFENAARYPNSETNFFCRNDLTMFPLRLVKLGPRTPENRSVKVPHPFKFHGENALNRQ